MWVVVVAGLLGIVGCRGSRWGDASQLGWHSMPSLPTPRAGHATCESALGLTVVGGTEASGSSDVLELPTDSEAWRPQVSLIHGRTNPVCAGDTRIFVFGGGPPHGEVIDPSAGSVRELGSTTPFGAGAVLVSNLPSRLFAFGGGGHQASVYDVANDAWSPLAQAPIARRFAGALLTTNLVTRHEEVWIFGGHDDDHPDHMGVAAIDVYDIDTNTWRSGGKTPSPLLDAVAAGDSTSVIVVGRVAAPGGVTAQGLIGTISDDVVTKWWLEPSFEPVRSVSGIGEARQIVLTGGETVADGMPTDIVEVLVTTIGL